MLELFIDVHIDAKMLLKRSVLLQKSEINLSLTKKGCIAGTFLFL